MTTTWPCLTQPSGCPCRCHAISAARKGIRARRPTDWRPEEDAYLLRRHDAGDTPTQLRIALNDHFSLSRSLSAIRDRLVYHGRSFRDGWYSAREVARMLGVDHHQVTRWHTRGLLPMTRHKSGVWFRVGRADLDAFVRTHAGTLLVVARIRDARLRSLAESSAPINRRRAAS